MNYKEKVIALLKSQELSKEQKEKLENIFPELQESEEERVRKAILELVRQSSEVLEKKNQERMLAWLEKQGEQKPNPYSGTSFEYNGHTWGMCARDNGVDILLDKTLFKHLEEQSEQILANSAKTCKDEQKHTPKHKVGDTIYYNSFGDVKSMIVANVTTDSTDNPMYEDENGNIVFEEDLIEYNTAWSEEDENISVAIENHLIEYYVEKRGYPYVANKTSQEMKEFRWLKSLKQRIGG